MSPTLPPDDHDPLRWSAVDPGGGPLRDRGVLRGALLFYGAMVLLALLALPRVHEDLGLGLSSWGKLLLGTRPGAAIGLGFAVGLLLVAITRLIESWPPIRSMIDGFGEVLGSLPRGGPLLLALTSGIAEELLFRGVLQVWWGLWPAAIAFGACHLPIDRRFLVWPLFALGAGLLFGVAYERSGALLTPVVAHVTVNWINLRSIVRTVPGEPR